MEAIWDKMGSIIAAMITALGGFYMYDRKTMGDRISKIETDSAQNRIDIRVIEARFAELKEDTAEIKETQKDIIDLLTKRRRN
jgi:hypothetical protein